VLEYRAFLGWMVLATGMVSAAAALQSTSAAGDTQPVPSLDARDEARKLVREIYATDFDAALRQPARRAPLAQTLLGVAAETNDDAAARFALLNEARLLAIEAGDLALTMQILDALEAAFEIPDSVKHQVRVQALRDSERAIAPGPPSKSAAQQAVALCEGAVAVDDFDVARQALDSAARLARKARDVVLARQVTARLASLRRQEEEYRAAKKALEALVRDPNDAEANLLVGRYRCFTKADWDDGLVLLALGNDEDLRALAEAELAAPIEADQQVAIADGWWEWAENLPKTDESLRDRIRDHAREWYEAALPDLTGLTRAKVESRLSDSAKTADGAVLVFRFERSDYVMRAGKTIVRDQSGHGNHGEVIACAPAPGVVGTGLRFDGNASVVQVPSSDSLVWEAFTISVWAYFEEERGGEVLVSNLDNVRINNDIFHFMRVQFKGPSGFRGIDGDGGEKYKPVAGRWIHFVGVWDGKRCTLWADGKIVSQTRDIPEKPRAPSQPLTLGRNTGAFTSNFKGVLDEVAIFNRALADREIEALYAAVPKDAAGQPAGAKR
jgi:hypothetical protein